MNAMNSLSLAGLAATVGVVSALLAAPLFHDHEDPRGRLSPMWAHNYATFDEMVADADAVVLATVVDRRPGRTVVTSRGAGVLPFTLVDLWVEGVIRGSAPPVTTVEQTGGGVGDVAFYLDHDGGAYHAGERVVLFLKAQPDTGYYYLSHPKGRFRVVDNVLHAVRRDDPVARVLDGVNVVDAVRAIEWSTSDR